MDATADIAATRLDALRRELASQGLTGFVVPKTDEHQGEYIAPSSERLHWLTGFSGSAGMAIVMAARAAIFIDGRYTLQVRNEVPGDLYDHRHVSDEPASDWLADHLATGDRLGYDPWLHTPVQVARLERDVRRAGAELVALAANPIDAVWQDRPAPPTHPVTPHPVKYAGEASSAKRKRLARGLANQGLRSAVLSAPDSIAWLLNVRGGDVPFSPLPLSFALLHDDARVDLFMADAKVDTKLKRHFGQDVRVVSPDLFGRSLDLLGRARARIAVHPETTPACIVQRLEAAGATLVHRSDPCQQPKARKNKTEIDGTRAAHLRDGAALTRFLAWLDTEASKGNLTEVAAADRLEAFRAEDKLYRGPSFPTIPGSGPNGAIVHYRADADSDRRLGKGELFLVDSGGQYPDGTTDVTRTIAIGKPTAEMRERFTRVLKGHIAIARAHFPVGTNGGQLDTLARQALWQAGVDYDHGTGHGVGSFLGVHEGPQRISKAGGGVALEPGMVVSNEPGYYKTGAYGIRIENLVLVTAAKKPKGAERELLAFETLTLAPMDLTLVDARLLDAHEKAWLNAYHKRVVKEVGPLVDTATRQWLKKKTKRL